MDGSAAAMATYERVAEQIRADIRRGVLKPGEKLPGNRVLADKYDVALGTAQKALRLLQDERWLTATPSVGVFVNEIPEEAVDPLSAMASELAELRKRVDALEKLVGER
ncbi:GntR family transcriptional regulator [Amycolatopsis sp. NPDC004378]